MPDPDPSLDYESQSIGYVAGIDEAGRGPLAGPVVAAAVILDPGALPSGLDDSKRLSARTRLHLDLEIREKALAYAVAEASVEEIDRLNILEASLLAMRRAVHALSLTPDRCLVDGNRDPRLTYPTQCIIKGDQLSMSIAAASILAKVARDKIMQQLARDWPDYGWEKNAGYGVPAHLEALRLVGVSPYHRKSFAPVRKILLQYKLPID